MMDAIQTKRGGMLWSTPLVPDVAMIPDEYVFAQDTQLVQLELKEQADKETNLFLALWDWQCDDKHCWSDLP